MIDKDVYEFRPSWLFKLSNGMPRLLQPFGPRPCDLPLSGKAPVGLAATCTDCGRSERWKHTYSRSFASSSTAG